jgi:hypothetical protein
MVSPTIGRAWRTWLPGLSRLLGPPWLFLARGAGGWLDPLAPFGAPKGRRPKPALAGALGVAMLSVIASPSLGCGPVRKCFRAGVAIAVSAG